MVKRILCLVLVTLIAVCGGNVFGQAGTDRQGVILPEGSGYLEKEIGRNSGVQIAGTVKLNSQDQLVVCDLGSKTPRYAILNSAGKPVGEIKAGFSGNGNVFALDAQDNLFILAQNSILDAQKKLVAIDRTLYVYAAAGSNRGKLLKQAALGKVTGEKAIPFNDLAVDSKGNLYCMTRTGIAVFDRDGRSKRDLAYARAVDARIFSFLDIDEQDSLLIAGFALGNKPGSFLEKLNPLTGQVIWKHATNGGIICGCYNRADHCTYLVGEEGVLQFDAQGRQLGSLLELKQYRILGFDTVISGINVVKGAKYPTIYLTNLNQQAGPLFSPGQPAAGGKKPYHIYQYSFTGKQTRGRNQKVITVATLGPDRFLDTAISAFQSGHPGIKIELQSFLSGGGINLTDLERFNKTVSAELMAGTGPDIISLGFTPFQKLADRNVLVDLNGLIARDKSFDRQKYYTNILDACNYKGGLYALPVFILFDVMQANQEILAKAGVTIDDAKWNWDDFMKAAEKVTLDSNGDGRPDLFALPNIDRRRLFNLVFQNQYAAFIDPEKKKAYFDGAEFIKLLNFCKSFSDKQLMNPQADPNAGMVLVIDGKSMLKSAISTVAFTPITVYGYPSLLDAKTTFRSVRILSLPGGSGFDAAAGMLFGINRRSKMQKEAWQFLKYLLSDEAQTSRGSLGFAVNKKAQSKRAAEEMAQEIAAGVSRPLNDSDMEQVETMIAGFHQWKKNMDPQLIAIINDELGPFFSGQKSAAEVAKLIQSKAVTYLQE